MAIQSFFSVLALCAASAFAADTTRTVSAVALLDTADTSRMHVSWKVEEVRDLRRLAIKDPNLLGTCSPLPFEKRTAIRTAAPVAQEVKTFLDRTLVSDSSLPVRIDLLSFETWTDPVAGPDPARARVMLRVVSLDSASPGLLLEPRAQGEKKISPRITDQTSLLRALLKDALAIVKPPFRPSQDTGSAAPEFERWADPSVSPAPPPPSRSALRQIVSIDGVFALSGVGGGVRYVQFLDPSKSDWTPEYWGGIHLHGPWNDDEWADVWSGELEGGMGWHRRLDAGTSPFVVVGSLGGLLGVETSRPAHDDGSVGERKTFVQIGMQGRGLLRYQPRVAPGLSWAIGPQLAVRVPSRLGWFDPALVIEGGWRF